MRALGGCITGCEGQWGEVGKKRREGGRRRDSVCVGLVFLLLSSPHLLLLLLLHIPRSDPAHQTLSRVVAHLFVSLFKLAGRCSARPVVGGRNDARSNAIQLFHDGKVSSNEQLGATTRMLHEPMGEAHSPPEDRMNRFDLSRPLRRQAIHAKTALLMIQFKIERENKIRPFDRP